MNYHTWKDWQAERNKEFARLGDNVIDCNEYAIKDYTLKELEKLSQDKKAVIAQDIKEYGVNIKYTIEFVDLYLSHAFYGLVLDLGYDEYVLYDDVVNETDFSDIIDGIYNGILAYVKKHNFKKKDWRCLKAKEI